MAKSDEVEIKVTLVDKITGKAKKIKEEMGRTFTGIEQGANKSQSSMSKLAGPLGVAGLGIALVAVGKKAIDAKRKFETLELTFKTILGSTEKAKERMKELADFASSTPFKLDGIAAASKTLETLTKGALSTGEGLRMVGDAAAVAGVPMEELSVHIGRAHSNLSNNRPAGEAIARMQELGLIAGDTRNEIEELQKQAKGTEAWDLLQKSLEKNSGAMVDLSNTFSGKISTLMDKIDELYRTMLNDNAFENMKSGVNSLIKLTEEWTVLLGGNLTMLEKIQGQEKKTFQDELMLSQARIQALQKKKTFLNDMQSNERAAIDKKIAKEEALSSRLAKSHQAEVKNAKVKEELDSKKINSTKTLSKAEQDAATQAIKDAEELSVFDERKLAWKSELRDEESNEADALEKKKESTLEFIDIEKQERQRKREAAEALLESDKAQDNSKREGERIKRKEKQSKEMAKHEKKLEKEKQDAFIETITIKQKVAKTGFLFSPNIALENKNPVLATFCFIVMVSIKASCFSFSSFFSCLAISLDCFSFLLIRSPSRFELS